MTVLAKCSVEFNQKLHTYHINGVQLGGVTRIVQWMYPDTYRNISHEVLEKAAERGSFIHENIELADSLGIVPTQCPEAMEYIKLRDEWGLKPLANEYLVTDGKAIASSIDGVYEDLSIADYKCTSKIHKENVRLQLSIYAYLFENMNKGKKVKRLLVVWLPREQYGKPKIIELERIPSKMIKAILAGYLAGEPNTEYLAMIQEDEKKEIQLVNRDVLVQIANVERQMEELAKRQKELRETIRTAMELHGVTKWETDHFKISLGKDSITRRFDAKRYQTEHPDLCADYITETTTKGRLLFTLKK